MTNNRFTRFLERIGVLEPCYVEGWPRGVRRVFPGAVSINHHIATRDPALWEAIRCGTVWDGLVRAQDAGLIEGVKPGALLGDVRIVHG